MYSGTIVAAVECPPVIYSLRENVMNAPAVTATGRVAFELKYEGKTAKLILVSTVSL
jgi:hypothetical protein